MCEEVYIIIQLLIIILILLVFMINNLKSMNNTIYH